MPSLDSFLLFVCIVQFRCASFLLYLGIIYFNIIPYFLMRDGKGVDLDGRGGEGRRSWEEKRKVKP